MSEGASLLGRAISAGSPDALTAFSPQYQPDLGRGEPRSDGSREGLSDVRPCGGPLQTHFIAFADPPPCFPSVSRFLQEDHRAQDALRPVRCSHRHGPEWCVSSFRSALKSGALTFERWRDDAEVPGFDLGTLNGQDASSPTTGEFVLPPGRSK